ncbi:MAG: hypothetical protein HKP52_08055 [Desulfofustis sp.]|nr:hypothetical protein [Desulfofustis sp.]NNK14175.1 hypothetical protein [Desulfofustis sp.]
MPSTTPIRWNNLHLDIPDRWEVIVKSTHHLIFEKNHKPLFEIRWHAPLKRSRQNRGETIARQLEPGGHYSRQSDSAELFPVHLRNRFSIETYCLENDIEEMVLLLTCKHCGTVVLVRIYRSSAHGLKEFTAVLTSLNCHPDSEERVKWQILDIYFSLPAGFDLEHSSFRFGLTTLYFKRGNHTELYLCRLAPASHHLQQSSLAALFHSFSSALPALQTEVDQTTLSYHHVPSLAVHLWSQIRRKKPHQASRFVHFPHHDRILGYSIRSRKPIETWVEEILRDGYGIVQEKEKATGLDA